MAVRSLLVALFLSFGVFLEFCGASCTYTVLTNMKGNQLDWRGYTGGLDQDGCKQSCTNDTDCVAVDFFTGTGDCYRYHSQTDVSSSMDVNFLNRTCTTDSCSMVRTDNLKGGLTTFQLPPTTAVLCFVACLYVTECKGVRFAGGTCSIYRTLSTDANSGDILHYARGYCSTGIPCCTTSTTLRADATSVLNLTASLDSCLSVCLSTVNCKAVSYASDVCYIYTGSTATSTQTGSTYAEKKCNGIQSAPYSLSSACIGATGTRLNQDTFLSLVILVMAVRAF